MDDPEAYGEVEVRFLQPYQATKTYLCPNCNREIVPGTGHYAVVPTEAPDLRRHWHRGCWDGRETRGATGGVPRAAKRKKKPKKRR